MNVQRGDVVLVDYPYTTGGGTKVRPVLVIQNDRDNQRLLNTIVAQITGVTRITTTAASTTKTIVTPSTPPGYGRRASSHPGFRARSVSPVATDRAQNGVRVSRRRRGR